MIRAQHSAGRDETEVVALASRWCTWPSVGGDNQALAEMAGEIARWIETELGAQVLAPALSAQPPIVHARLDVGAPRTVILYNMYDVMPAPVSGWSVDPFAGAILDLPALGPALVARGAENNKGPLAAMLTVVRDLLRDGTLGVNVEILIDGEEESGSRAVRAYLEGPQTPVAKADAVLFPSLCEYAGGPPRVYLGFSGIARGEVRVAAGDWGGPSAPAHSSSAAWIDNPAWRLIRILSSVTATPSGQFARRALDGESAALVSRLAERFDFDAELRARHAARFALTGSRRELLAALLTTTVFNLAEVGTTPTGLRGAIPEAAFARFDLRAPPGVDPARVVADLAERAAGLGLDGAHWDVHDAYPGRCFEAAAPGVQELVDVYTASGATPQIWPWAPGAAPAYAFAAVAPAFLIGGLGSGGNAHGVDEYMTVRGAQRLADSVSAWLSAMGRRHREDEEDVILR